MLSTDRLTLLQLFVKIAESGKISEAADACGISQPSASRLLKRLESILGTQLVHRKGAGITLTDNGQQLLSSAKELLRRWDSVEHSAKTRQKTLTGHIRVAVSVAIGECIISTLLARFLKMHPGLTVECDLRDDPIDKRATEYDLWVRAGQIKSDRFVVRQIAKAHRALFCAPGIATASHPRELQAARSIRAMPFVPETIELSDQSGHTFLLRQVCTLTTNNIYAAHAATLEGAGFAILPFWLARPDIERGKLIRLCDDWEVEPITLSIAYLPGRTRPVRVVSLTRFLEKKLADTAGISSALIERLDNKGFI